MRYFDTAFIIKLYLCEEGSEEVVALANHSGGLACSDLGYSEFHAALHRNLREQRISRQQFEAVLERFVDDCRIGQWQWIPVSREVHETVAGFFLKIPASVFLRCADAIHLATAKLNGFTDICTNDRHLGRAASSFGLGIINPLLEDEPEG